MPKVELVIQEKTADIGSFSVGRLLPQRVKRSIGPFVFMDHIGPVELSADENLDVPPHPHIGLSTLTYLFDGAIMHRDSLGTEIEIQPGAVNLMTAGKGIVHSERTPEFQRVQSKTLHGFQIWLGLPKDKEQCEPSFVHIPADKLPVWQENNFEFKLIAGELLGKKSPVPVFSKLYFLEMQSNKDNKFLLSHSVYGERAVYILKGSIRIDNEVYKNQQILLLSENNDIEIEFLETSVIYIFGGEKFPEERYIQWNYVSSDMSLIEQAIEDWQALKYPAIPNEPEYNEMLKK